MSGTGRRAEAATVRRLGGRAQPASGAMPGAKADMKVGDFLVENKATEADSVRVMYRWLAKVSGEAQRDGRVPALAVQFTGPDGVPRRGGAWVMVPEATFHELLERSNGQEG